MTLCDRLFSYSDLPRVAPWLTEDACRQFIEHGLFRPQAVHHTTDTYILFMNLYDLIALSAVQQLIRCGITEAELRSALKGPSSFRKGRVPDETYPSLTTGASAGQELSRFLELNNGYVTILVRVPLAEDPEIEFIPNDLLGPQDYHGVTMTGVECRAIREIIENNIANLSVQDGSSTALGSSATIVPSVDGFPSEQLKGL
jgi:hypothetical protein